MALKNTFVQKIPLTPRQLELVTPSYLGKVAEAIAARYLQRTGHEVLFRNWRCREGELDLISQEGAVIVITEVKLRQFESAFSTRSSVDHRKRLQVYETAKAFCAAERQLVAGRSVRIDAIRICYHRSLSDITFRLDHLKHAVGHAETFTLQKKNHLYRKKTARRP